MTFPLLLLSLMLPPRTDLRTHVDTIKVQRPKPTALAPSKPPAKPPKAKPVGEPQLTRRKPPPPAPPPPAPKRPG